MQLQNVVYIFDNIYIYMNKGGPKIDAECGDETPTIS